MLKEHLYINMQRKMLALMYEAFFKNVGRIVLLMKKTWKVIGYGVWNMLRGEKVREKVKGTNDKQKNITI